MIVAKSVVKNKFWIVESEGNKVGTIQAVDEQGGYVYVQQESRETFPSINLLKKKYNIDFAPHVKPSAKVVHEVHGYPSQWRPYNILFDVKKQLPIFTRSRKSKSFYGAGYYLIKFSPESWVTAYCPKVISLARYPHQGPFKTQEEANIAMGKANGPIP